MSNRGSEVWWEQEGIDGGATRGADTRREGVTHRGWGRMRTRRYWNVYFPLKVQPREDLNSTLLQCKIRSSPSRLGHLVKPEHPIRSHTAWYNEQWSQISSTDIIYKGQFSEIWGLQINFRHTRPPLRRNHWPTYVHFWTTVPSSRGPTNATTCINCLAQTHHLLVLKCCIRHMLTVPRCFFYAHEHKMRSEVIYYLYL